jgi:hypothetical protein
MVVKFHDEIWKFYLRCLGCWGSAGHEIMCRSGAEPLGGYVLQYLGFAADKHGKCVAVTDPQQDRSRSLCIMYGSAWTVNFCLPY